MANETVYMCCYLRSDLGVLNIADLRGYINAWCRQDILVEQLLAKDVPGSSLSARRRCPRDLRTRQPDGARAAFGKRGMW